MDKKLKIELSKIEQSALIDLYEVDLSSIVKKTYIFRFHNGLNELRKPITWQGAIFEPYPIKAEGFTKNGQGTSNRPTLTLANISGLVTGLASDYEDMLGAVVTRKQVMVKFLDAVNFEEGNIHADPNQEVLSMYIIERLISLTSEIATFELALPCESDGSIIPARTIIANTCCWQYRTSECSYTGGAVANEYDEKTTELEKDKCSRSLTGCKLRFGEHNILPFGGFPSSSKLSR